MPPRKRKRPSDQPASSSPTADRSNATLSSSASAADDVDTPPFLNTTFTAHRVSPLHLGPDPLTQPRLHVLSQRLRDLLVGDVIRGIEVGLDDRTDDPAMRRAGALELVSLGWVRLESLLGRYDGAEGDPDTSTSTVESAVGAASSSSLVKRRAVQISLQYENAECVALLLPAASAGEDQESRAEPDQARDADKGADAGSDAGFLHLPLLLLRMPPSLRAVICGFISRTFDCRISALSLGTRSLVGALERWLGESGAPTEGPFAKDVVVTLGFYGPTVLAHANEPKRQQAATEDGAADEGAPITAVGLKAIDIIVPNADLRRFARTGSAYEAAHKNSQDHGPHGVEELYSPRKRRQLGGNKDEEAWMWRHSASHSQPFIEALAQYIRGHLALDLFHPAVRVVKIACGGFVLSEGRVKIFGALPSRDDGGGKTGELSGSAQKAVWAVFEGLGQRARVRPVERSLSVVG